MAETQLRLSESLSRRLARRAAPDEDLSQLACRMVERGLKQDGERDGRGTPRSVSVQLDPWEMELIERECAHAGLTRAEWIRACLRARLSRRRQFGRLDRTYLRRSVAELQEIKAEVKRLRRSGAQTSQRPLGEWAASQILDRVERSLHALSRAIHEGFMGNDAYWRDPEPVTDVEVATAAPRLVADAPPSRRASG